MAQPAGAPPSDYFQTEPEVYYHEDFEDPIGNEGLHDIFILHGADDQYRLCVDYQFVRYLTYDEVISDKYQDLRIFEENK